MKENQIVKIEHQNTDLTKVLYRYGGPRTFSSGDESAVVGYYIMDLENSSKCCGYANSLSCFLKPTIKDIIDYVDMVNRDKTKSLLFYNEEKPNEEVTREIAIIIKKQHLKIIKDFIRPRMYKIYNDLVDLDQWDESVAVVISKKSTNILPEANIVDAKDLAKDIPTIDSSDLDLEDLMLELQNENTIRFLFTGTSAPSFAGKDFEISKFNISTGPFDSKSCELELLSKEPIINSLGHNLLSARGIVKNCGTRYEVSEMYNISQNVEYGFGEKEHSYRIRINFKNFKVLSTQQDECILNYLRRSLDYKYNFDDTKRLIDHNKSCNDYLERISDLLIDKDSLKYMYKKLDLDVSPYHDPKDYLWERRFWDQPVIPMEPVYITVPNTENTNEEKENDIMKINDRDLKQIIIDEDRKTVTTITTEQSGVARTLGLEPEKHITVAKASKDDEFDPYVGVAMTLAYQLFGSKEEFRKFVRENESIKNLKKEREAREAAKLEAQEKAEEAKKRAAARKAKRAAKRAEQDEKIATAFLKKLAKFMDKTETKTETVEAVTETNTEKSE